MSTTTETQIVREAPEIEALKLALMQDAQGLSRTPVGIPMFDDQGNPIMETYTDAEGNEQTRQRVQLPTQQVSDFSQLQKDAFTAAGQTDGIGGYQPYLTQAGYTMGDAQTQLGTAMQTADPYRQAAEAGILSSMGGVPGQVTAGQTGIQRALGTAGTQLTGATGAARGFAGTGMTGIGAAAGQIPSARQLGVGSAQQGIASLGGASQQFSPSSIQPFMSAYEDAAVDRALADVRRQGDIQRAQVSDQAIRAGAFGGSRAEVAQRELDRNVLDQQARTAAQMRAQGFESAAGRAQQAFEQARARQLQSAGLTGQLGQAGAGTALQASQQQAAMAQQAAQLGISVEELAARNAQAAGQLGLSGAQAGAQLGLQGQQAQAAMSGQLGDLGLQYGQFGLQGGEALGTLGLRQASLGELAQKTGLQNIQTQYELGKQQQLQNQAAIEAKRQSDMAQLYEPYQRLSYLSDIYKGAPSSQQTIASSTSPGVSPAQSFLGLGIAGLSAAAGAQKAGLFG